ncbi:DNA-binding protein [Salmonella enterica subsp. enterica]|nr:DNA-binding protein [Salmonella enterica subsp. enterica]
MIQKSKEMVRLPEIINDLAFHASQVLIESMNIDSASAENAGQAIADRMMRNWGGQSIYFPKGISGRASERIIRFTASAMGVIMRSWPKSTI